jgi:hypothetical protein
MIGLLVFFNKKRKFVTIIFRLKDVMKPMFYSITFKMNHLSALPALIKISPIMNPAIFNVFHNVELMKRSIIYLKTLIIVWRIVLMATDYIKMLIKIQITVESIAEKNQLSLMMKQINVLMNVIAANYYTLTLSNIIILSITNVRLDVITECITLNYL